MHFHQRSQISVIYVACGHPVLAPAARGFVLHIVCLLIITWRSTTIEGRYLCVFCQIKSWGSLFL